jgi:LPXTG-site transpeptidase (sortase) family protein
MSSNTSIPKSDLVAIYREALLAGLPMHKIDKKVHKLWQRVQTTEHVESSQDEQRTVALYKRIPRFVRWGALAVPLGFIAIGLFLVGNAVVPIGQYYLETVPSLVQADMKTPIPRENILDITPAVIAQAATGVVAGVQQDEEKPAGPQIIDIKLDYTNLANWFADADAAILAGTQNEGEFTISIPKVNIENASVKIGGTNLNDSLIQFPGTALPGDPGAPVIFGHSVLRQFYNPSAKNPRRYTSIFSTIMTLKTGDEIIVKYKGVEYRYAVREKTEVKPEDVYILTQNYDARQLKLVTCTPEGTYLRRGVVTASLIGN